MDDTLVVSGREPAGDLGRVFHHLPRGQGSCRQSAAQVLAFEKLRDGKGRVCVSAEVVDGEDVRMGQGGHGARLALEACEGIGVLGQVCG